MRVGAAQPMDYIELIIPNSSFPRVHVYIEGFWLPPKICCGVGSDFYAFQIQSDQLAQHLKDAAILPPGLDVEGKIHNLLCLHGEVCKGPPLGYGRGKIVVVVGNYRPCFKLHNGLCSGLISGLSSGL